MFRRAVSRSFSSSSSNSASSTAPRSSHFSIQRGLGLSLALGGALVVAFAIQQRQQPLTLVNNVVYADAKKVVPSPNERTFIAVKPDGVQRGLVGKIIDRFETKGYKLVAIKSIVPSKELAEIHYGDLKGRPFYNGLVSYMTSGKAPVIAMVWEGIDVIKTGRKIIGATNPLDADPGSIRGQYCISVGRNIIHGSDSLDSAAIEIPLWFTPQELNDWKYTHEEWITSKN